MTDQKNQVEMWAPAEGAQVFWTYPDNSKTNWPNPQPTRFHNTTPRRIDTPTAIWSRYSEGEPVGHTEDGIFIRAHFAGGDAEFMTNTVGSLLMRMAETGVNGFKLIDGRPNWDIISLNDFCATNTRDQINKLLQEFPADNSGFSTDPKHPIHVFYTSQPYGPSEHKFGNQTFYFFNDANRPDSLPNPPLKPSDGILELRKLLQAMDSVLLPDSGGGTPARALRQSRLRLRQILEAMK